MKLSHLSVLAVLCASVPSIASAITISNATQLAAALKMAKGGEVFDLAPGNYGALSVRYRNFSTPITFRSVDASKPATFSSSFIYDSSGIQFSGVAFSNLSTGGFGVRLSNASNVTFSNIKVTGTLSTGGIYMAGSKGISIVNSDFTQLARAVGVDKSSNINLIGNSIYGIRSDGFNFAQVDGVKISGNQFRDFTPAAGDHPDAIQFWTTNTTAPSKNIEISNNLIVGKVGAQMQGIFVTDQKGSMYYQNVVIKNNTLIGTGWNGIMLHHATGSSVTGNVLVTIPGSTVTSTWIRMENVAGLLSGNTVKTIVVKTSPDLQQSGNIINTTSTSLAELALQAWYTANNPVLPSPDEVAQAPVGSNTSNTNTFTAPIEETAVLLTNTAVSVVPVDENGKKNDAFSKAAAELKKTNSGKKNATSDVQSAIPEPATWAQLLLGFGLVGWVTRRARRSTRSLAG